MKLKELLYWVIFIALVIQVAAFFLGLIGVPVDFPEPYESRYGD
jgi:hypothetical protein